MTYLYSNNATSTLLAPIGSSDVSLTVQVADASKFPSASAALGTFFMLTLLDAATKTTVEIVKVTQTAGNVFTIVRAQEGTTASAYAAGAIASHRVTAGAMSNLAEVSRIFSQGAPTTLASASTVDIGSVSTVAVEVSGTTTITSFGTNYNGPRYVRFQNALTLTHNTTTLNLPGAANITTTAGDVLIAYPNLALNGWNVVSYQVSTSYPYVPVILRSYISGLTLSTVGSSTTMSIAAGQATDSTNIVTMNVAATNKTTANWALGSGVGGLDTGTIAASTWYYFYAIRRPDTGVTDVVFSANSSAPTLPSSYTQYRYIGAGLTNGSSQWTKFTQFGDEFTWDSPPLEFSSAGSTTASLLTLTVPRGRKMKVLLNTKSTSAGDYFYFSDPANSDLAPSQTTSPLLTSYSSGAGPAGGAGAQDVCWTNTSAQIRHREGSTSVLYIATVGWTDLRGKDL